jgi:ribosomal protein S18 acetylase RimI-like enzyme
MDDWAIEKLNAEHDREQFTCGNALLDAFLKTLATQYEKRRLGRTYVATLPGKSTVRAYYSIASGSFSVHSLPQTSRKKLPKHPVPTAHLGRLAVDVAYQGQGLGRILLFHCLATALHVSQQIGVLAVDVIAIDEPSKALYQRYGFMSLEDDTRHLYLPIGTVEKMFAG